MRKIQLFAYEKGRTGRALDYNKVYIENALFHYFAMDYEEFNTGVGNFPVAVIERGNGEVKSVPVELIKFIHDEEEEGGKN